MASSREYAEFILGQCRGLCSRAMMGEYLLYYNGKLAGGIYDNRLLVKPTGAARALLQGAKPMLLVENVDDGEFLRKLFEAMHADLPEPKKRK